MKTYKRLLMLGLSGLMCILTACGSDDSEDVPSESKPFVGIWNVSNVHTGYRLKKAQFDEYKLLFFTDGTMLYTTKLYYGSVKTAYWNYGQDPTLLSTTIENESGYNYQWQITLLNDNTWSGMSLWGEEQFTNTSERLTADHAVRMVLGGIRSWKNKQDANDKLTTGGSTSEGVDINPTSKSNPLYITSHKYFFITQYEEDKSADRIIIKEKSYVESDPWNSLELVHPYTPQRMELHLRIHYDKYSDGHAHDELFEATYVPER